MRVINLKAENFQILKAVDVTPGDGPMVKIGGKNEQGKSSVMDAIWVALAGRAVAAPVPIRVGEQECRIHLDIGDFVVQRKFTAKEGAPNGYTDSIKVLDDRGRIVPSPQATLNDLMGAIGFDPFAFTKLKPDDQAEQLLQLVPLPIDLEDFAEQDRRDFATRRDRNRDVEQLAAQLRALPQHDDAPAEPVDREAILQQLGTAAETNGAIDRDRLQREEDERSNQRGEVNAALARQAAEELREQAAELIRRAEAKEREAAETVEAVKIERERLAALPPLAEPVDTAALRQQLQEAEAANAKIDANARRAEVQQRHDALKAEADAFTTTMDDRERQRQEALQKAKMPVDGLGFAVNDRGKPVVTYDGLPFSQASTAAQIRASTAIAMAANPELRVLRIKDGSLLDEDSLAMIAAMAAEQDYQLWVEVVGTGGVGFIIENGEIRVAEAEQPEGDAAPAKKAPAKKAAPKAEGPLL